MHGLDFWHNPHTLLHVQTPEMSNVSQGIERDREVHGICEYLTGEGLFRGKYVQPWKMNEEGRKVGSAFHWHECTTYETYRDRLLYCRYLYLTNWLLIFEA